MNVSDSKPDQPAAPITKLLRAVSEQESGALDQLMPLVYEHLRAIAAARMAHERRDHSFQPTALVHEAFVKVLGGAPVDWQNRAHFFNTMAKAMRHILVDHARAVMAGRPGDAPRGGPRRPFELPDSITDRTYHEDPARIAALDEALTQFERVEPRAARVVVWRFFNGMTLEQIASASDCSLQTVKRDWTFARSWLVDALSAGEDRGWPQ